MGQEKCRYEVMKQERKRLLNRIDEKTPISLKSFNFGRKCDGEEGKQVRGKQRGRRNS